MQISGCIRAPPDARDPRQCAPALPGSSRQLLTALPVVQVRSLSLLLTICLCFLACNLQLTAKGSENLPGGIFSSTVQRRTLYLADHYVALCRMIFSLIAWLDTVMDLPEGPRDWHSDTHAALHVY